MKDVKFSYCAAIRTLGKAGDKFQQTLDSLKAQTIPPRKIFVVLPVGYELPKETIGVEEYVRVPKGMVSQRVWPSYSEVADDEYLLLLDDDVFLPPDGVERLYGGLAAAGGDVIAADVFRTHEESAIGKIRGFITNWARPRRDDGWAFKISRNCTFSYNNSPKKAVCPSESAAGPCSLWSKSAFESLHLEDEVWLDNFGFGYGDDLLEFYKLVVNGGKLLVHYDTGIVHLDAKSERINYVHNKQRIMLRSQIWFVLWWRICYGLNGNSRLEKMRCAISYGARFVWDCMVMAGYSCAKLSPAPIVQHLKGVCRGVRFVHSDEYRRVPNFIVGG